MSKRPYTDSILRVCNIIESVAMWWHEQPFNVDIFFAFQFHTEIHFPIWRIGTKLVDFQDQNKKIFAYEYYYDESIATDSPKGLIEKSVSGNIIAKLSHELVGNAFLITPKKLDKSELKRILNVAYHLYTLISQDANFSTDFSLHFGYSSPHRHTEFFLIYRPKPKAQLEVVRSYSLDRPDCYLFISPYDQAELFYSDLSRKREAKDQASSK